MRLTNDQRSAAADVHAKLVARGIGPARAAAMIRRAAGRAAACCAGCRTGRCCDRGGLGDAAPIPPVLASIAAAGDDPSIAAARNIVSKWSWLIPVSGLIMSAGSKVSSVFKKGDPALAVAKGMRRR